MIRIIKLIKSDIVTIRYEPMVPARLSLRITDNLLPTAPPAGKKPSNSEELYSKAMNVVKDRRKIAPDTDFLKRSVKFLFLKTTKLV